VKIGNVTNTDPAIYIMPEKYIYQENTVLDQILSNLTNCSIQLTKIY